MTSRTPMLNMKPASYPSLLPSMGGGHQDLALDHVLTASKVMYCEKCGFASMDVAVFKKHMVEHMGPKFYCFYCNNVSYSEAELNTHLKQHTAKYPFTCPHCGQGYRLWLCLVKHMERMHSNNNPGLTKPSLNFNSHLPVPGALSDVSAADPLPHKPTVRVTVPAHIASTVRQDKVEHREKTQDTNTSKATNGNTELLSSVNGLMQYNRALTVALPEEVTIPAGCLVELVEVKTVNGIKELKLRLVSQQENESVIKDTRSAICQGTTSVTSLSSTLIHQSSTLKPDSSVGMCTVNRKLNEMKSANVERPPIVPVTVSKNLPTQVSKDKSGFKRTSQEIINLECDSVVPNKIPKSMFGPVRDGNNGMKVLQQEPRNLNASPPALISSRGSNRLPSSLHHDGKLTSVPQRAGEQKISLIPELSKSIATQRTVETKCNVQKKTVPVKLEPRGIQLRNNFTSTIKKEVVGGVNQQQYPFPGNSPPAITTKIRPPEILSCKNNVINRPVPIHRTISELSLSKLCAPSSHAQSNVSSWTEDVRSSDRAREGEVPISENFPVISSVFSLSQQPEEAQGAMQPLVMALRGIVMEKSNSSTGSPGGDIKTIKCKEPVKEAPTSRCSVPAASKNGPVACDRLNGWMDQCVDTVTDQNNKGAQGNPALISSHVDVKEEKIHNPTSTDAPASKSPKDQESVCKNVATVDTSVGTDIPQLVEKSEQDASKFLSASPKREQTGTWKKHRKGLILRISKCKSPLPAGAVADCEVMYPMPLRKDQRVKKPSPYQPIVVLNHPKPRASSPGTRVSEALTDTDASDMVPKCQILKMKLSKVMGQKYEVIGCTVRGFP